MNAKRNKKVSSFVPQDPFQTPASLGFAMPAEWETHAATWIAWPHNEEDWPGKFAPVPWIYADIVRLLARGERVNILVQPSKDGRFSREVRGILEKNDVNMAHVTLHAKATDRVWLRDSGPVFLNCRDIGKIKNQKSEIKNPAALVDFKFNAWAKYDNSLLDDQVPAFVEGATGVPRFVAYGKNDDGEYQRFVLEGGSIDVNGAGCVLTTEECLLSEVQQRNPGFSREQVEATLAGWLGIEKVLWLERGIAGDDTHGHIDDTARFVGPKTIVACVELDKSDANYGPMKENLRRLVKMRDARGRQLDVVELPLPEAVWFNGQRLPASYANFYIANAGMLVPVFNDPNDGVALRILEGCFKDRPVIPVYCRDLVWGLGTLHCLTQQQPA